MVDRDLARKRQPQSHSLFFAGDERFEQLIRERQRIEEERRQAAALARRRAALLAGREAPSEAPEGAPGAFSAGSRS